MEIVRNQKASSSTSQCSYRVFLSFRGEDTRKRDSRRKRDYRKKWVKERISGRKRWKNGGQRSEKLQI
ncbi:hypothetical protein ACSBR1_004120 [Camellia fascicularis]